jgi:hypothetical protein
MAFWFLCAVWYFAGALMMEAVRSSEMSANRQNTTRSNNPHHYLYLGYIAVKHQILQEIGQEGESMHG